MKVLISGPSDLYLSEEQIESAITGWGIGLEDIEEYRTTEDMVGVGASVKNYAVIRGLSHLGNFSMPNLRGVDWIKATVWSSEAVIVVKRSANPDGTSQVLIDEATAQDKLRNVVNV